MDENKSRYGAAGRWIKWRKSEEGGKEVESEGQEVGRRRKDNWTGTGDDDKLGTE